MRWAGLVVVAVVCLPMASGASERRLAYTYESAVLGPGQVEVELWTTLRAGRKEFYRRFDERLELEVGLTERLQTALYLNLTAKASGPGGARESELEFAASSEWKLKLSDPVADALGSALYLEGTLGPTEAEVEAKLILDKRAGGFVASLNLAGEVEWTNEGERMEQEVKVEGVLGLGYLVTRAWSVGLEARSVTSFAEGEVGSVIFLGPTVAYASQKWWAALSLQPQLAAVAGATAGSSLDLERAERFEGRLLVGFDL